MNLLKEANLLRKEINPTDYRLSDSHKKTTDILKIVAILLMVIDHIGAIIFTDIEVLRWIGRPVFIIFAYQITQGYIYTKDFNKYMFRLWIFALVTQIPYSLAFDTYNLNVMFTFILGLFLIDRFAKKEYYWIFTVLFVLFLLNVDYEWYGVLLPLAFYLTRKYKLLSFIVASIMTVAYTLYIDVYYQAYAIIGVFLVLYLPTYKLPFSLGRYFFYWFYPVHLLILFIIRMILLSIIG
jgi:hypothetical protein